MQNHQTLYMNSDMGGNKHGHVLVFIMLCFLTRSCESWNWFSSSSSSPTPSSSTSCETSCGSDVRGSVAEFSVEGLNDRKGLKLVENAKEKMMSSTNLCWKNAYKNLFAGCSDILVEEDKRSRVAWHLSDCFQKESGRPRFPYCDSKYSMQDCLRGLDDGAHRIYLEFYIETNSICHQLQAGAFNRETERLVTDLKNTAHYVEDKLDTIYDKSENILRGYKDMQDSVDSMNLRTQQMDENIAKVVDRTKALMRNSESIYEETKRIAESQMEFKGVQEEMKGSLKEGIDLVNESYTRLGQEIGRIREESIGTHKEMVRVGQTVAHHMQALHTKTEDIADLAATSLDNQQHLLLAQSQALHNLNSLSNFQSQAFQETRMNLQEMVEVGSKHHQEVVAQREQLLGIHDRLMTNSKSILAAQESFESKQSSMFTTLEKIFSLQNAMFLESRMIKAFIVYFVSILVIYMLTSTKQTYNTRPWLYIGLCVALLMEISIVRFGGGEVEQQAFVITLLRSVFFILASAYLLYAIFTYRDYGVLNYHLIQTLNDKVNNMEQQRENLAWMMANEEEEEDDGLDWSKWVASDLPEEASLIEDPDFMLPFEEVGDNAITVSSRKYNLRSRRGRYC